MIKNLLIMILLCAAVALAAMLFACQATAFTFRFGASRKIGD